MDATAPIKKSYTSFNPHVYHAALKWMGENQLTPRYQIVDPATRQITRTIEAKEICVAVATETGLDVAYMEGAVGDIFVWNTVVLVAVEDIRVSFEFS